MLIPDIGIRLLTYKEINFSSLVHLPSILFTTSYIMIILFLYYIKPKLGKIIYIIITVLINIYTLAQIIHFNVLDRMITITNILVADQGTGMIGYTLRQIKLIYILIVILSIIFLIISIKLMKKENKKTTKKEKTMTLKK